MSDFVNFPFRAFVTMIYWTSTEVLLNLVAPLDSAVPSLDFEQINVFWTSGFDSVSIVFDLLSEVSLNCISRIRFKCSFLGDVGKSLPDVQSREMQILEDENDANMQQKFNTSTCSVCNKDAKDKYTCCSECHIQIHYRCTFLPSYQLYCFVEKKSKYTRVNCTPTGLVDSEIFIDIWSIFGDSQILIAVLIPLRIHHC